MQTNFAKRFITKAIIAVMVLQLLNLDLSFGVFFPQKALAENGIKTPELTILAENNPDLIKTFTEEQQEKIEGLQEKLQWEIETNWYGAGKTEEDKAKKTQLGILEDWEDLDAEEKVKIAGLLELEEIADFTEKNGVKQIIDPSIVLDGSGNLATAETDYQVAIGESGSGIALQITNEELRITNKNSVKFTQSGASVGEAIVEDNKALYKEIYPFVDLLITTLAEGVKEDLILKEPVEKLDPSTGSGWQINSGYQGENQWVFDYNLELQGLTVIEKENGLSFLNAEGKEVMFTPAPVMYDREGKESWNARFEIVAGGNDEEEITNEELRITNSSESVIPAFSSVIPPKVFGGISDVVESGTGEVVIQENADGTFKGVGGSWEEINNYELPRKDGAGSITNEELWITNSSGSVIPANSSVIPPKAFGGISAIEVGEMQGEPDPSTSSAITESAQDDGNTVQGGLEQGSELPAPDSELPTSSSDSEPSAFLNNILKIPFAVAEDSSVIPASSSVIPAEAGISAIEGEVNLNLEEDFSTASAETDSGRNDATKVENSEVEGTNPPNPLPQTEFSIYQGGLASDSQEIDGNELDSYEDFVEAVEMAETIEGANPPNPLYQGGLEQEITNSSGGVISSVIPPKAFGGISEVFESGTGSITDEELEITNKEESEGGEVEGANPPNPLYQGGLATDSQLQTPNSQLIHIRLIADATGLAYPIDLDPTVFVKLYDRGARTFAPNFGNGNQNGNYSQTNNPGKINRGTEATQTGGTLTNAATSGFTAFDKIGSSFAGNSLTGSQDWTSASTSLSTNKIGAKIQFTTGTGTEIWAGLQYSAAGRIMKATVDKGTDYEVINYIDTYSATSSIKQKTLLATGLRNTTHTVELELTGQKNISQSTSTASASSSTYVEDVFSTYLYTGGKTEYSLLDKNITAIGTNFSPSYPLSNINDGIAETSNWNNVAYNSDWTQFDFYLDLGTSEVIDQYSLAPQGTAPSTFYNTPTAFDVYASDDAVDWDLIHSFSWISTTYPDWEPGQYRQFIFSNTQSYQYWRFKATAEGKNSAGISLSEIHVSGSNKTINNGIDLAGNGGLVWTKDRAASGYDNVLVDTVRGINNRMQSNSTAAQYNDTTMFSSVNSNGYTLGAGDGSNLTNVSAHSYASWTFREAPKFFDIVSYTGNGTTSRNINHSLGITPGMVIVKRTDTSGGRWAIWHRSSGDENILYLDLSQGVIPETSKVKTANTENFTVGNDFDVNTANGSYVAYVFAHDTSADGLMQCGSYTTDSSGYATVNLGWEPQWILHKSTNDSWLGWRIEDSMRNLSQNWYNILLANLTDAEFIQSTGLRTHVTSNGFVANNTSSQSFIYCAIRRPMKTPTDGTKVFSVDNGNGVDIPSFVSNFPVDLSFFKEITGGNPYVFDRIRGTGLLNMFNADSETSAAWSKFDYQKGWSSVAHSSDNYSWMFRRAPGFFDVVAYTGDGTDGRTLNHNLGVTPEMMIFKSRTLGSGWRVYSPAGNATKTLDFSNAALAENTTYLNSTAPTSSLFTVGGAGGGTNNSGETYISYLFATLPGISKVGSYTGDGTTGKVIDAGFTGGAKYLMIKRTDSTGDWLLWDATRGIVSGNDPHISLNSTAAEVTTDDSVDPDNSGFVINQNATTNINVSGGNYVYYAVSGDTVASATNASLALDYIETYSVWNELATTSVVGTADSGKTTALVDAALTQADDFFNGYALTFTSGAHNGKTVFVTDFNATTDTLIFTPALSSAVSTESYQLTDDGILINSRATRGILRSTQNDNKIEFGVEGNLPTDDAGKASQGTFSVWVKPSFAYNADANQHFVFDSGLQRLYYDGADDQWHFAVWNGTNWTTVAVTSATQTFSANDAIHLTATWDATSGLKLAVNNVRTTASFSWTARTLADVSSKKMFFGTNSSNANLFNGVIAEPQIFDYVLSNGEINDIYVSTSPSVGQAHTQKMEAEVADSGQARKTELLFNSSMINTPNDRVGTLAGGAKLGSTQAGTIATHASFTFSDRAGDLSSSYSKDSDNKLLIHSDTTDGSTTFTDSSLSDHTITPYGNVHHETDAQKFGATSMYFDGSWDYLNLDASDDWKIGSAASNYTVDFWLKSTKSGSSYIIGTDEQSIGARRGAWGMMRNNASEFAAWLRNNDNSSSWISLSLADSNSLFNGSWHHIAWVLNNNTFKLYVDGTEKGSVSWVSGDFTGNYNLRMGADPDTSTNFNFDGYLDEIRISKGIARWTSSFTPPTVPYSSSVLYATYTTPANTTEIIGGFDTGTANGIARVIVDEGTAREVVTEIDTYNSSSETDQRFLIATGLDAGAHTVKVEANGIKNLSSTSATVALKFIETFTSNSIATSSLTINNRYLDDVIVPDYGDFVNGIKYPEKGNISESTNEGTIWMWLTGSLASGDYFFDTRDSSWNNGMRLYMSDATTLALALHHASSSVSITDANFSSSYNSSGANHLLARWWRPTSTTLGMSLYLNGVKIAENKSQTFTPTSHSGIILGNDSTPDTTADFDGAIYDFSIYANAFDDGGVAVDATVANTSTVWKAFRSITNDQLRITNNRIDDSVTVNAIDGSNTNFVLENGVLLGSTGATANTSDVKAFVNGAEVSISTIETGTYARLNGALTATGTSLSVDNIVNSDGIPSSGFLYLGNPSGQLKREKVYYASYSGGTFSGLKRGTNPPSPLSTTADRYQGGTVTAWADNTVVEVAGMVTLASAPATDADLFIQYNYSGDSVESNRSTPNSQLPTPNFLDNTGNSSTGWKMDLATTGASGSGQMITNVAGQTALAQMRGTDLSAILTTSTASGGDVLFVIDEGMASEQFSIFNAQLSNEKQFIKTLATSLSDDLHTIRIVSLENATLAIDALTANGSAPILQKAVSSAISHQTAWADLNPITAGEGKTNAVFYWETSDDTDARGNLLLKGAITATGSSLIVDSATASDLDYLARPSGVIQIGNEKIKYGNFAQNGSEATLLNLQRGYDFSAFTAHSDNATITPKGGWTQNATTQNSSWFDEVGTAPEKLKLFAMDSGLTLLDSADNSLWMHFAKTANSLFGDSVSNLPASVVAQDGAIFVGFSGTGSVGLLKLDFKNDLIGKYNSTDYYEADDYFIADRNSLAPTWATGSGENILNNGINALDLTTGYLAVATAGGVSIVNLTTNATSASTETSATSIVKFDGTSTLYYAQGNVLYKETNYSADFTADENLNLGSAINAIAMDTNYLFVATNAGVKKIAKNNFSAGAILTIDSANTDATVDTATAVDYGNNQLVITFSNGTEGGGTVVVWNVATDEQKESYEIYDALNSDVLHSVVLAGEDIVVATEVGVAILDETTEMPFYDTLEIVSGNNQLGEMLSAVAQPLRVRVSDGMGRYAGTGTVTVNFSISSQPTGIGTGAVLSSATAITDGNGYAEVNLTLGDRAGDYQITANFEGATTPQIFTITEKEKFVLKITGSKSHIFDLDPNGIPYAEKTNTVTVTHNADNFDFKALVDAFPTDGLNTIGDWDGTKGFAWMNGTTPTAFGSGATVFTSTGPEVNEIHTITFRIQVDFTSKSSQGYDGQVSWDVANLNF